MNKTKILIMLAVITASITSGCVFGSNENKEINGDIDTTYISKAGTFENREGKYVLEVNNSEKYYLESIFKDLSKQNYENKKVQVMGLKEENKNSLYPIINVEEITILETEQLDDNKLSSVKKTYTSDILGITLDYSESLSYEEKNNMVIFIPAEEEGKGAYSNIIEIQKYPINENKKDLKTWISETFSIASENLMETETGANHQLSYKHNNQTENNLSFYTEAKDGYYRLSYQKNIEDSSIEPATADISGGTNDKKFEQEFYEILFSFELASPIEETSDPEDKDKEGDKKTEDQKPEENKKTAQEEPKPESEKKENKIEEPENEIKEEIDKTETIEEDKKTTNEEKVPAPDTASLSENKKTVTAYFQKNLPDYLPKEAEGKTWEIVKYEFVGENMVYVEYHSGSEKRKTSFSYQINNDQVTDVKILAHYVEGQEKDWDKAAGTDSAAGKSKEVVDVTDSGEVVKKADVQAGYRLFESKPYKFTTQIPANWYFAGSGGSYYFSDKPATSENAFFTLSILPHSISSINEGTSTGINGKKAYIHESKEDQKYTIYLEKSNGQTYKLSGSSTLKSIINQIANSIVD
ncbi:MAG: hypothetical protein UR27_C0001G0086 [Candidatus Peregrinibacteria bacterium GW2011_GWA2_33_10]|nr:MAG: hypothetical protein UR27_C0001G0086 [Candidatus Peregrinibacteria bacterium GW2011_GWA2_33_10]KKP39814.1 MAG: variable membrane protein precursor [Candidatus Peregrinibacteria bacterium GW2011_GWC2_33_13]OGJ49899.1 MAG: hypothetical protein A2229_03830 [Candidatus Peregrinibacteria bacterium RIFOXYA2_FULL_33_7]